MKKLIAGLALFVLASLAPLPASTAMTCELTGAKVESCCCIEKDGQMVCTLTGETVTSCCCD